MPQPASDWQREIDFASQILACASSMLAYWDTALICRYANPAWRRNVGIGAGAGAGDVVGMHLRQMLGEARYALDEVHVRAVLAGVPQMFERNVGADSGVGTGLDRRHRLRYHPVFVDLAVVGFVAEVADLSAAREEQLAVQNDAALTSCAVAALRKRDAAHCAAEQLGGVGSWAWEVEADITTWSPELYRLFGCDPARLPPTFARQAELYVASSWRHLREAVDAALLDGRPYVLRLEYRRPGCGKGWIEVRGEVERDARGIVVGLRGTAQDVTTAHSLVDAVIDQTEHLKLALAAAQLGMIQWDGTRRRLVCENQLARAIFGLAEGDGIIHASELAHEFLHPDDVDSFCIALEASDTTRAAFFFRGRIQRRHDGRLRWIECFGRYDGFNNPEGVMIGTVADITERLLRDGRSGLRRARLKS